VRSSDPAQRFGDIIENIERIERFTAGMDLDCFAATEQTVIAVKYCLLVISEAAAKLGDLAAEFCPSVPWREIRGLGNRLRHDYGNIDVARLWRLVELDLPPLKVACSAALIGLDESGSAC
jgi:uncharacterized protein with HEPN domain